MLARFLQLPFFVILVGIGAVSMYVPAFHAAAVGDIKSMQVFFHSANIFLLLTAMLAVASVNYSKSANSNSHLFAIAGTLILLPLMLAVPFKAAVPNTTYFNTYIEMVSSITTTGATLYEPERIPQSVHLWRGQVAWLGGFFMWLTAIAVLAPMRLGGFEVLSDSRTSHDIVSSGELIWSNDISERLVRYTSKLFPVYLGLTVTLWLVLLIVGDRPLVALSHAMSTLSTSGISPVGGVQNSTSGWLGEFLILLFLVFAVSRNTFGSDNTSKDGGIQGLLNDPEFRLGLLFVIVIPALLFLRHFIGAYDLMMEDDFFSAMKALWGSVFSVLSFLTTTGFESATWDDARRWSGLETPGVIFVGLSIIGGGVATTAGGVKLLRVFALYKHGEREMYRLIHPSVVGGSGATARRLRREGAQLAWVFFMLFAMSIALISSAFSLSGIDFDTSLILAVSGLSTTGPLVDFASETPVRLIELSVFAKVVYACAMVLGRLETLAAIALFNPELWRK